jgi:hypothetical protein
MNLSDGMYRAVPCFTSPELAEAIVKGYHGDGFEPVIPRVDDIDYDYRVTFRDLWSEANLYDRTLALDEYKGVTFELENFPAAGDFHVKVYGDGDGKEQYFKFSESSVTVTFDPSALGAKTTRATLQYLQGTGAVVLLKSVHLIRQDGTLEASTPSVFWGCEMEMIANQQ